MVITPEQKVPSWDFKQEPVKAWNEPDSKNLQISKKCVIFATMLSSVLDC